MSQEIVDALVDLIEEEKVSGFLDYVNSSLSEQADAEYREIVINESRDLLESEEDLNEEDNALDALVEELCEVGGEDIYIDALVEAFCEINDIDIDELNEDQLDEISNYMKANYIGKASADVERKYNLSNRAKKKQDKAENRAMKAFYNGNEKAKKRLDGKIEKYDTARKSNLWKGHRREYQVNKAKESMREDTDQLDEISKAMAGRYINQSVDSIDKHATRAERATSYGYEKQSEKHEKKLEKRKSGIEKAVNRLTKEDFDYLVENYDRLDEDTQGIIIEYIDMLDERNEENKKKKDDLYDQHGKRYVPRRQFGKTRYTKTAKRAARETGLSRLGRTPESTKGGFSGFAKKEKTQRGERIRDARTKVSNYEKTAPKTDKGRSSFKDAVKRLNIQRQQKANYTGRSVK